MTTTNSIQTGGAFVLTSIVCKSGFFYKHSSTPTCQACDATIIAAAASGGNPAVVANFPVTDMYTVVPDDTFFTTIKTCSANALGWLAPGYTCKNGYVPLTLASNAKNADYLVGGCYSCDGATAGTAYAAASGGNAEVPAVAATNVVTNVAFYVSCTPPAIFTASFILSSGAAASTATAVSCADGYSLVGTDTLLCKSCNDNSAITGALFTGNGDMGVKTCKIATGGLTFTSFKCIDGYIE